MAKISYTPKGVCSRQINVEVEDGIVKKVQFIGGCNGNTQGVAKLAEGRPAREIIELLRGTDCNGRGTSCPAQLAIALEKAINE
ncbi:MAG: TIGR03905 family TSCPD domain-containing protein [Ruminococcus sp.]|nr:TIGR03905 family TSCPD domain-containing protein [Ruminococcus sp.]